MINDPVEIEGRTMMKMNFAVLFVIDHFYILLMPVGVADRGVPFVFLLLLLLTKQKTKQFNSSN